MTNSGTGGSGGSGGSSGGTGSGSGSGSRTGTGSSGNGIKYSQPGSLTGGGTTTTTGTGSGTSSGGSSGGRSGGSSGSSGGSSGSGSGSPGGTGSYVPGTGFVTDNGKVYPTTNPNWVPSGYSSTSSPGASSDNTGGLPAGTYNVGGNKITIKEGPANGISPIPITKDTSGRPVTLVPGTTDVYTTSGGGLTQARMPPPPAVAIGGYSQQDYVNLTEKQRSDADKFYANNKSLPPGVYGGGALIVKDKKTTNVDLFNSGASNPNWVQERASYIEGINTASKQNNAATASGLGQKDVPAAFRSDYTGGQGVISAAPKETLKLFGFDTGWEINTKSSGGFGNTADQFQDVDYKKSGTAAGLALSVGVWEGVSAPVLHTPEFLTGLKDSVFHPIKTIEGMGESFATNPYGTAGQIGGSALFFKGVDVGTPQYIKDFVPKPAKGTFTAPTEGGNMVSTTYGLEAKGRGLPLLSVQKEVPTAVAATSFEEAGGSLTPKTSVRFGSGSSFNIAPDALTKQVPAPEGAVAGSVFRSSFDVPAEQVQRSQASVTAARQLQYDKGLPVKDVLFKLENVKSPQRVTGIVEKFAAEEGGVFFGSTTTQQLPKGFQNVKVGDIDIVFPSRSVNELTPRIADLAGQLKGAGENVRVSAENPLIIESIADRSKIFEAKSGVDQFTLGEELAPAGFYGIKFADLKAGQTPTTVPFGNARAITAGEQFARKGAAVNIVRPTILEGMKGFEETPASLREGGIFGAPHRTVKDTAGFIQSGRGLIAIRESEFSINPFKKLSTDRAKASLNVFEQSFSPEQQFDINVKIADLTGEHGSYRVPLKNSMIDVHETSPFAISSGSFGTFIGEKPSSGFYDLTKASSLNGKESVFNVKSPSLSAFGSPSNSYASPFESPSPSASPASPSSFGSPSPSLFPSKSASPSPYKSPSSYASGSPSGFGSPSPSISPSPYGSPSPYSSPSPSPSPSPSVFGYAWKSPIIYPASLISNGPKGRKRGNGFLVQIKRKGKFVTEGFGLTHSQALNFGQMKTRSDLSATFRVRPDASFVDEDMNFGSYNKNVFRNYKISGGKKIALDDTYIQRRGQRLGTGGEIKQIQRARSAKGWLQ